MKEQNASTILKECVSQEVKQHLTMVLSHKWYNYSEGQKKRREEEKKSKPMFRL